MDLILMKGIVRNGRVEVDEPIDLPEGTELRISLANGAEDTDRGENGPVTSEEIARVLSAMEKIVPFDRTPEEEARLAADRLARKEWEKAHFNEHAEKLRRMWE
jgi:hypothetical protein